MPALPLAIRIVKGGEKLKPILKTWRNALVIRLYLSYYASTGFILAKWENSEIQKAKNQRFYFVDEFGNSIVLDVLLESSILFPTVRIPIV
jgi:hypothetical protein